MATIEAPPRLQVRLHEGPFVNEPYVDFNKEENAHKMRAAIEKSAGNWVGNTTSSSAANISRRPTKSSRSILQNRRKSSVFIKKRGRTTSNPR